MKPFSVIAAVVFSLIAVMQSLRLAMGWSIVVNGVIVPMWVSVVATVVAATLAVLVWREARRP